MTADELARFFSDLESWVTSRTSTVETVAYGKHEDQVFDLRRPESMAPQGLALVIHGGFWRAGFTRRNTAALATALTEAGWSTANIEYRRLGPGRYQETLDDLRDARRQLNDEQITIGVGHSAGGQLALWLAAVGAVDAVAVLGGICDLAAAAEAGLGDGAAVEFLGGAPDDVPGAYACADPASRLPLGVQQILVHGTHDDRVPVSHAQHYAARAVASGDHCLLVEVATDHFGPIDPRSPAWPVSLQAINDLKRLSRKGVR